MKQSTVLLGVGLATIIIAGRLVPHVPNFAPVSAVMIISQFYLKGRQRWFWPFTALLVSDLIIGLYSLPIMLSVYASYALISLAASRSGQQFSQRLFLAIAAAVNFFVVTNLAVWLYGSLYPHTWSGLLQSYALAVPFFRMTLASDLIYVTLLSVVFEWSAIKHWLASRQSKKLVLE